MPKTDLKLNYESDRFPGLKSLHFSCWPKFIKRPCINNIGLRSDQVIKVFFCFVFNFNTMLGTAPYVWEQCLC